MLNSYFFIFIFKKFFSVFVNAVCCWMLFDVGLYVSYVYFVYDIIIIIIIMPDTGAVFEQWSNYCGIIV